MNIKKWKGGKNWAVFNDSGELITVTVYKKGAEELIKYIAALKNK